jgi:transcription initiation factor TFIID subunit TAF12
MQRLIQNFVGNYYRTHMKAVDLERLLFNPFHTSRIIHHFLCGVQSNSELGIKHELLYIVLPLMYNRESVEILMRLNKTSKYSSFFKKNEIRRVTATINERIEKFRPVTNKAIIILSNYEDLEVKSHTWVGNVISHKNEEDTYLKNIHKASYNLGIIMGKENYLSVFKSLNIINI